MPSWCDRILWKSYPETHIICNSYGQSLPDRVMGDPGWSLTRLCLSFGKCKQRIRSFPLSPHSCSPPQVAQMTSSPATTPPCLGHLRLGLPLSSSPRKVAILDVLVGVASIWVAAGAGLGMCIGLNTSKCVCVCVCLGVYMYV